MSTARRPIVLLTAAYSATGGIPHYLKSLVAALERVGEVRVVDVRLSGSRLDQGRALVRAIAVLIRMRPSLLVLGNVSFGPVGMLYRLVRGRYVVVAYGNEIWGPPSLELDLTLRFANAVWPISTFTAHEVLRRCARARVGPVLGAGIEPAFFQAHDEDPEGPFRVLVVSRLDDIAYKGIDVCLSAVGQLVEECPIELRIVGDGPARQELERLVVAEAASRYVRVLGRVALAQLLAEYRQASVVALVSRFRRGVDSWGEGLGLAPLEAGAAGTPAVVSACGGTSDVVIAGSTGLVVEPGDVQGLATALRQLVRNPTERRMMGDAARVMVHERHSRDSFRHRVLLAVEEVR